MPAARGTKSGELLELIGYIFIPDNRDDEAEDSEDDDDELDQQPEFLDVSEIDQVSSGGHLFGSTVPVSKVLLETFSGKSYQVEGRFALMGPWWEVTCWVVKRQKNYVVKGFPSYKLRSDLKKAGWIPIVSLFLNACGVEEACIQQFFELLPKNKDVSLHNLIEVLDEFSEAGNEDQVRMIRTRLLLSDAWMQVQASSKFPNIMKYLPKLLPRHFTALLGIAKKSPTPPATQATQAGPSTHKEEKKVDMDLLAKLEEIIAEDVWKLGFNKLVYRELKLVRCEAQLKAFKECNLLQKIPLLQRHSLLAYDELKKYCHSTGSTFMNQPKLCQILTKGEKMSDEDAWNAIDFLKKQAVVVLDSQCSGICKVVLQNYDFYEKGIAKCLQTLVERGPWRIPVNPVEVLQAAAEERAWEEDKNSEDDTNHHNKENYSVPTNIPDLTTNSKASPTVKSEFTFNQNPSSAFPEQQAGTYPAIQLDQDHVQAAQMICANPVTIISGKAGCGKTTLVSQLLKAAVQQDTQTFCLDSENGSDLSQLDKDGQRPIQGENEILLTAPTGRAASVLSKKTNFKAYTLHQVLFRFMNKKKNPELWEFKDVRILVVDEGSMVPVELLHSVLNLLIKHAELHKFILLGDVRQLPSIKPGNVLNDLFNSLKRIGWAIEMRTNHRAESQLIVDNAGLIADMGMSRNPGKSMVKLNYDAIVDLGGPHTELTVDKKFILIRLPEKGADDDVQTAIKVLIGIAPGLKDDSTSQFITFKRADVLLINELCCRHYNKHLTKNHKKKLVFQPGDKVCCTMNGYVGLENGDNRNDGKKADIATQTQSPEKQNERASIRLCNGEIFFIREDVTKQDAKNGRHRYLTLDDCDGRVFTVNFKELQRECKLRHAWARTIHTYQGSENESIVYVVGDSYAQRWKHIYTAITRGQKRVYVVSKEKAIDSAIKKREIPRDTRLQGLVKEYVVQGQELIGTPQAQPNTPRGTPSSCKRPQSTQGTPSPGVTSPFVFNFLKPKRLWEDEEKSAGENVCSSSAVKSFCDSSTEPLNRCETVEVKKEEDGPAVSAGHKRQRSLSAEPEEKPCKQVSQSAEAAQ